MDASQLIPPQDAPEGAGEIVNQQLGKLPKAELVSPDVLNTTSNIFAHLLLMGFLASAGQKVASIGTQLVRPINVKLRAKEGSSRN